MSRRPRAPENAALCRWQVTAFGREDLVPRQLVFRVLHAGRAKRGPNLCRDPDTGASNTRYLAIISVTVRGGIRFLEYTIHHIKTKKCDLQR